MGYKSTKDELDQLEKEYQETMERAGISARKEEGKVATPPPKVVREARNLGASPGGILEDTRAKLDKMGVDVDVTRGKYGLQYASGTFSIGILQPATSRMGPYYAWGSYRRGVLEDEVGAANLCPLIIRKAMDIKLGRSGEWSDYPSFPLDDDDIL